VEGAYFESPLSFSSSLPSLSLLPARARVSLAERRQFRDDDDDIARHAAATSIRMNTEESITVPICGADRRRSAARSGFASAARGIEIIIIARAHSHRAFEWDKDVFKRPPRDLALLNAATAIGISRDYRISNTGH